MVSLKKPYKRKAAFDAVLVYMDGPQVVTLMVRKTRILAIAIPDQDDSKQMFLGVSVSKRDWDRYLGGTCDLRYIFTIPAVKTFYYFDLNSMKDNFVIMESLIDSPSEAHLPLARFFSSNHTEDYISEEKATDSERLLIDGEWQLTDFGQFQQKFSDIYTFTISSLNWKNSHLAMSVRRRIQEAFLNRPFQGGFSYVHLFRDLEHEIPRPDQLDLRRINYASPGQMEIYGKEDVFSFIQNLIPNFIENRTLLQEKYNNLYNFLSKNQYLKMRGDKFYASDSSSEYIKKMTIELSSIMGAPDYTVVSAMTGENHLVSAKIVLAFYRRLSDTSAYFTQGRVSYPE